MNNSKARIDGLSLSSERQIDQVCDAFEAAWKAGRQPRIEEYLNGASEPERSALLRELLLIELAYVATGAESLVNDYIQRFPQEAELVRAVFQATPQQGMLSTTDDRPGTQIDDEGLPLPEVPGYEILGILGR